MVNLPSGPLPSAVFVKKRKRQPGRLGLWRAYVVATDEFGTWLFSPKGSLFQGEKDGQVSFCEVGQGSAEEGLDVLHLAPVRGWWFGAWAVLLDGHRNVTIDICSPPTLQADTCEYVDLELDLWKSSDGTSGIADEDEFDDAFRAGWISEPERQQCRAEADRLHQRLTQGDSLFDADGWSRYQASVALGLPPLMVSPQTTDALPFQVTELPKAYER